MVQWMDGSNFCYCIGVLVHDGGITADGFWLGFPWLDDGLLVLLVNSHCIL